jgi:uncharacterized protein VirK/YbjX
MPFELSQRLRVTGSTLSLPRIGRVVLRVIGNLPCQMEVLRLMKHPLLAGVLPFNPRFAIKFAADDYLARGLSVVERKTCFIHHYTRLLGTMTDGMLRRILHRSLAIYELCEEESVYRVVTHLSRPWDKEGELSLELQLDGLGIYVVSFSIIPGSIVKSEASEVLLISRLQGMKGKYKYIQRATKAMSDVAPASFLLSALEGFAEAFGIREIVGVSALRQSAYGADADAIFRKAYDEFFQSQGAVLDDENLFRCPVPLPEKPLQDVKRGHKLRTKEKRAFKREVAIAVRRFFQVNRRPGNDRLRLEQPSDIPAHFRS